jgi:hypothetical protein
MSEGGLGREQKAGTSKRISPQKGLNSADDV